MKPIRDPLRTNVVIKVVPGGQPEDDHGDPGNVFCVGMEAYADHLCFNCPGCGRFGCIRATPAPKQHSAWLIVAGSLANPTTLSLIPSIHCVGCCGWHGYLTNGIFNSV